MKPPLRPSGFISMRSTGSPTTARPSGEQREFIGELSCGIASGGAAAASGGMSCSVASQAVAPAVVRLRKRRRSGGKRWGGVGKLRGVLVDNDVGDEMAGDGAVAWCATAGCAIACAVAYPNCKCAVSELQYQMCSCLSELQFMHLIC